MTESGNSNWPAEFPKSELRADVDAMVQAITETLVSNLGDQLAGLWHKGSAVKAWDTPIDYVPEISDVDIHYRLRDAQGFSPLADLDLATSLHSESERKFKSNRLEPLHTPRPQLVSVSDVEKLPDYVPSPSTTVRTLYGEVPPEPTVDPETVRLADARGLMEAGDPQTVDKAVRDLLERPGHHLFTALRPLNWRLSPIAPRALSVLGLDYETAWSSNRTSAVRLLRDKGQGELAREYAAYYEAGWDFFASNWRDEEAGRSAFAAAVRGLKLGRELGRKFLHLHADYRTS